MLRMSTCEELGSRDGEKLILDCLVGVFEEAYGVYIWYREGVWLGYGMVLHRHLGNVGF